MAQRLEIEEAYPDVQDGSGDMIVHTNKGTFLLDEDELEKLNI